MVDEIRGIARLRGFRGGPRGDEAALRDAVVRVGALLDACPEIQELDINPISVFPHGASALDVRIRVGTAPPRARTRRVRY
jgi:acetyltransferase